ncbi:hypothetical protein [Cellulophaga baltica]|uniref:hypothetical protein n=1 Tax=Cellulophaga baltica TaxID=76594 RepID=UPI0024942972|nr:hypothetical protein [Cellulophaga baltica]
MKKNLWVIIVLVLIAFTLVINNMGSDFDKEMEEYHKEFNQGENNPPIKKTTFTDNEAAYAAQQFVERNLKVPSSADFDALFKSKVTRNGKEYTVISYVESENSFGAKIRSKYVAVIKRNSTGGVSLIDLVIE